MPLAISGSTRGGVAADGSDRHIRGQSHLTQMESNGPPEDSSSWVAVECSLLGARREPESHALFTVP